MRAHRPDRALAAVRRARHRLGSRTHCERLGLPEHLALARHAAPGVPSPGTPRPAGALFILHAAQPPDVAAIRAAADLLVPVVAVGHLYDPGPLIAAVHAGATALVDLDLPLIMLLDAVREALSTPHAPDRAHLLRSLRTRQREGARLGTLTRRELQVLTALGDGANAPVIANELNLSTATVRSHIRALLRKLGVSSQLSAVAFGRRNLPPSMLRRGMEDAGPTRSGNEHQVRRCV